MPNLSETVTFTDGTGTRGGTVVVSAPNLLSFDINFSSSGQVIVPNSGDALPLVGKMAGVAASFPGVGCAVQLTTYASGGVNGLVIDTVSLNSGYQQMVWWCSGAQASPFNLLSGAMSAMKFTNTSLLSGQSSSGAFRVLYQN